MKQTTLLLRAAYISVLLRNHSHLSCFSNKDKEFFEARFSSRPIRLPGKEEVTRKICTWFENKFADSLRETLVNEEVRIETVLEEIRYTLEIPETETEIVTKWLLEETLNCERVSKQKLALSA